MGAGQSTITIDVNLVNVFATIQDADGRYVTDLGRDDFELYEDGVLQAVEVFEREDDLPTTVGVLIDNSGSSAADLDSIKSGVLEFESKGSISLFFTTSPEPAIAS